MDVRQKQLLNYIIQEHIKSALPISSQLLVDKYYPRLSSATIRNDLVELEEEGFLYQPHPSSGRIPNERGYRYYLENIFKESSLPKKQKRELRKIVQKRFKEGEQLMKNIAKVVAALSKEAVVVSFDKDDIYYTGISYLFGQPEFVDLEFIYGISETIDHLDETIGNLFGQIDEEINILIGSQNPFWELGGAVVTNYKIKDNNGIVGILGPMRMDYNLNIGLLKYVQEMLREI